MLCDLYFKFCAAMFCVFALMELQIKLVRNKLQKMIVPVFTVNNCDLKP